MAGEGERHEVREKESERAKEQGAMLAQEREEIVPVELKKVFHRVAENTRGESSSLNESKRRES